MSFTPSRPPGGEAADTGPEGSGAPGIENTAVERRKAKPVDRKTGCVLFAGARLKTMRLYGAPLPLFGGKTRSALSRSEDGLRPFCGGAQIERSDRKTPAGNRSREGRDVDVWQFGWSKMSEFGFEISSALVTDVDPAANVKAAMHEIQTQRRLQEAASAKVEAEKILTVKHAEAEAESKRLQGEGIAKQRVAIAQGLKDSVRMVADAAGVNPSEVLQTVLLTQYFDTMKDIGVSAGSKVILIPHSAGGMNDVAAQLRDSMAIALEMSNGGRK